MRAYATEKPFLVTTRGGAIVATFYTAANAISEAKAARGTRCVLGRHRGDWKHLLTYVGGAKDAEFRL